MPPPFARLSILRGNRLLGRYPLLPGRYIVGADPTCDIQLPSTGVAPQHLLLDVRDTELAVEDLGSDQGTFVDDVPVRGVTPLKPEQGIRLADLMLRLHHPLPSMEPVQPSSGDRTTEPFPEVLTLTPANYRVDKLIARGGMGAVVLVEDRNIRRVAAMKVMRQDRANQREEVVRFIQEAQLCGQLEHPNIVPVHELGVDEQGAPYYTMKYVQGTTLETILSRISTGDAAMTSRFPLSRMLVIFQKVCDAVAFAHSRGVIHRDLTPANIMVGDYGEVLLMDWGLAKLMRGVHQEDADTRPPVSSIKHDHGDKFLTSRGEVIGTPAFMSPEQAQGDVEGIDVRTDVYGLGAILYNMLTLSPPISGESLGTMLSNASAGSIPTAGAGNRMLPRPLCAIAMRALHRDRAMRYQTVEELQAEVQQFQDGLSLSPGRMLTHRRRPSVHQVADIRLLLFLGVLAALLVALFLVGR